MYAAAKLDEKGGYVYEFDGNNVLTAIVFIGTIYDGNPDAQGNLVETDADGNFVRVLSPNWEWRGAFRLEGEDLAALPAAVPATDGTPADPRYQAIFGWLGAKVKAAHAAYAAIKAAETIATPRPDAEVAALPALTPAMLTAMGL